MHVAWKVDFCWTRGVEQGEHTLGFFPARLENSTLSQPAQNCSSLNRERKDSKFLAGKCHADFGNQRRKAIVLGTKNLSGSRDGFSEGRTERFLDGGQDDKAKFVAGVDRFEI